MEKLITITNNTDWLRVPKSQLSELLVNEPNWHTTSKSKAKHLEVKSYKENNKVYSQAYGSIKVVKGKLQSYYKPANVNVNRAYGKQHIERQVCHSVRVQTTIKDHLGKIYSVQSHTYTMGEFLKGYRTPDDTSGLDTIIHNTNFKVGKRLYHSEAVVTRFNYKLHRIVI